MQAYPSEPCGTLEDFDEETRQVLERDLRQIREVLARRQGDRRQWRLQPVMQRLADMDLLRCQHLLTANSLLLPHARRCPACPSELPARTFRAVGEMDILDWFSSFTDEERGILLARWKTLSAEEDPGPKREPQPRQT